MPLCRVLRILLMTMCWIRRGQSWERTANAATGTGTEPAEQQSVNCISHYAWQDPPEWLIKHNFTPSDLLSLKACVVVTESKPQSKAPLVNVSWQIGSDGSITKLEATMICIQTYGDVGQSSCMRCNYMKPFQSPNGQQWEFHYLGFPVEPHKEYHINAYNIPTANMNEDAPKLSYKISIPGCENATMKYTDICIARGSLWNPNITTCQTMEAMEVNFTVSSLAAKYDIQLLSCPDSLYFCTRIGKSNIYEANNTRVSVRIPMDGKIHNVKVKVTLSFPSCGADCVTHQVRATHCFEDQEPVLKGRPPYIIILTSLSLIIVAVPVVYFIWKHGKVMRTPLIYSAEMQPALKVLLIYHKEKTYFQSTVLAFAEFLNDYCRADVILDMWQQERIAEMGPVQWLVAQKDRADKIIFLISSERNKWVASLAETTACHKDAVNFMFNHALNIFCCDLKNQSSLNKYMVVHFDALNHKDDLLNVLDTCSRYYFMKDIDLFCKDLLNLPQASIYYCNKKLAKNCKSNLKCIYKLQTAVLQQRAPQAMSTSGLAADGLPKD
uniref:Interleukin-17 receptor B n=1 Tax=Geotrypetes seraphini TaxID=260995 RepID=A0A6P8PLK4_GEOSA|nr:interleukin-17 receptor B [Geotrypetes seraphini]